MLSIPSSQIKLWNCFFFSETPVRGLPPPEAQPDPRGGCEGREMRKNKTKKCPLHQRLRVNVRKRAPIHPPLPHAHVERTQGFFKLPVARLLFLGRGLSSTQFKPRASIKQPRDLGTR